jgi:hypothetical protein
MYVNAKMILFQESGEGMKDSSGVGEFKYDIFHTL